jgi:LacI family transcriptional regulator
VHAPLDLTFAFQRHQGFLRGMSEAGLKPVARHVVAAGFSRRGGHEAMQALLTQEPLPTAVIVDNNICGVGVVRALLDAGLVPGRDISVIVYDGMPADTLLGGIAITAIAQPEAHAAGVQLAELMLGVVGGKPLQELQMLWQPRLAPGASDGPVSARPAKLRTAKLG